MLGEVGPQDALQRGIVLRGYSIRSVLGRGGFGIVYRARHIELGYLVAIKEYLPGELATRVGLRVQPKSTACIDPYRDGLRRFRDEGKALVALHDHPNVVSCKDFFRCHGTAYLVMEFVRGMPLSRHLQQREAEGRPFGEEDLMAVAVPLIEGLGRVHEAGVVHRDIKPSNVLLREENRQPVLIDFGAAKQDWANHTKSVAPRTPGYAAWEQVVPEGDIGTWTDIYAIGVLLWRIVSGGAPDGSLARPVAVEGRMDAVMRGMQEPMPPARELGEGRFDVTVLATIDTCLRLRHDERVQDCTELLHLITGDENFQYRLGMEYFKTAAEPYYSEPEQNHYGNKTIFQYMHSDLYKWHRFTTDHDERIQKNCRLLSETVRWLKLAAYGKQNNAQHHLAFMTYFGVGVDRKITSAIKWWTKAAESGHTEAQYTLGMIWTKAYVYTKHGDECEDFIRLCGQNTYLLDDKYYKEAYAELNIPYEAAKWLCKAANNDHVNAQVAMAIYAGSNSYVSNPTPFPEVQFQIGRVYQLGKDVPRNYTAALTWYRIAAQWHSDDFDQSHHSDSMNARQEISKLTSKYLASPKLTESMLSSARGGEPTSQYNLGWMYSTGTNLETDHDMAVHWYRLAAQQGDVGAQNNLGVCYILGYGVPRDQFKALYWFLLATNSQHLVRQSRYYLEQLRWEDNSATACFRLALYRRLKHGVDRISASYHHLPAQYHSTQCFLRDRAIAEYNLGIALLHWREHDRSLYHDLFQGDNEVYSEQTLADRIALEYDECFTRAASTDHSGAQYHLGLRLLKSEKDKCSNESMKWFKMSAEQGHIGSLHMLATHYRAHNKAIATWASKCYRSGIERLLLENSRTVEKFEVELHREAIDWYVSGGLHCDVPCELRLNLIYDVGENDMHGHDWLQYYFSFDSVTRDIRSETFRKSDCDGETHFRRGLFEQIYGDGNYEEGPTYMFRMDEAFHHFRKATTVGSDQEEDQFGDIDYSLGHPGAMNNLGIIYASGHDDVRDPKAAVAEFLRAAEYGHPAAQFNLGVCFSKGIGVPVDTCKAFKWFNRCAESSAEINCRRVAGYSLQYWPHVRNSPPLVDALFNLAVCHIRGIGTPRDVDLSIEHLVYAADDGDEKALCCLALPRLGEVLNQVPDCDLSSMESIDRRMRERRHGYRDGEDRAILGWRYAIGFGVKRDAIRAFRWFVKASSVEEDSDRSSRGVARNMADVRYRWAFQSKSSNLDLQVLPWSLRFIESDTASQIDVSWTESSAFDICRNWAEFGDPDAQYFYAWMCANGEGIKRCLSEAFRWYRHAAVQGHISASYRLALMYDEGRGVVSDPVAAAMWYEVGAKNRIIDAQYRLALLYEKGRGVRRDWDVAAKWYEAAAADGDLRSKYRLCVISHVDDAGSRLRSYDYFDLYDEILRDREESDLDWMAEALGDEVQPSGFRLTTWAYEGCSS